MTSDIGVRTWEDLARKILEMAPEERKGQIQVVTYNTDSDAVHALAIVHTVAIIHVTNSGSGYDNSVYTLSSD